MGDARPSILAPNRSYPLPPLFPLFPIMILTKTRISLGLPPPNPAYHLAWVHRAVYPLAWDPQTPHIPWLGIPKPRISLGLGFPKPEYPLAWDSQNPHIPWLRFSLFSRFSFFAQIGIAAPLVEPAPQRRLPHTQLRSHFNPSSLTSAFLRSHCGSIAQCAVSLVNLRVCSEVYPWSTIWGKERSLAPLAGGGQHRRYRGLT